MRNRHPIPVAAISAAGLLLALASGRARAAEPPPFQSFTLPVAGIVRNFITADFNGDGLRDVVITHIVIDDVKRKVERYFSLFLQGNSGFPNEATQRWEAPTEAVGIDVGNFDLSTPGPELGYLSSAGVFYFKFGNDRFVTAPSRLFTTSTLFRAPDPYGVIVTDFARDFDGDGQEEIVIFDFDQTHYYTVAQGAGGTLRWELTQIFPTPLRSRVSSYWENDILLSRIEQNSTRIELMMPQIFTGDVDGDGLADLFLPHQDRVLVYRQIEGRAFTEKPILIDFGVFALERGMRHGRIPDITRLIVADFNGDALADVIVSRLQVADLSDAKLASEFYVFINENGRYPERPNEAFLTDGFVEQPMVADYNGDDRDDIALVRFPFGFFQWIRMYLFQRVEVSFELYRSDPKGLHNVESADVQRSESFRFDLSQQSASLLMAHSFYADFDGDRRLDVLQAADPKRYRLLLSKNGQWASEEALVEAPTSFFTFPEDVNGDGRDDLLIRYAGRDELDATVRILLSVPPSPRTVLP